MVWIVAVIGIAVSVAAFMAGRTYQKKRTRIMCDVRPQRLYAKDLREAEKEVSEAPKGKWREPCPAQSCPFLQEAFSRLSLFQQPLRNLGQPKSPMQPQSDEEKGYARQLKRFAGYSYVSKHWGHHRKQCESSPFHVDTARRYRFLPSYKKQTQENPKAT